MKIVAVVLVVFTACLFAQDVTLEPEYANQYFVLADGKLERLEHSKLKMQSKTTNYFVAVKGKVSEVVDGLRSPVRVAPDAHFIIRLQIGDMDPASLIHLKPFTAGKNDREILMHSGGAVMYGGHKSQTAEDNSIPVTVKKYGTKSLEVIPSQPLVAGEYFFQVMGLEADCFGVDGK